MTIQTFTDDSTIPPGKTVLLFTAEWHESHPKCEQLLQVLDDAKDDASDVVTFAMCLAEDCPKLTKTYSVQSVPTVLCLQNPQTVVDRIVGDEPAVLTQAVAKLARSSDAGEATSSVPSSSSPQQPPSLTERLDGLIRSSDVMVFMKGTPDAPRCGFSRQLVELLQHGNISFGSFDILSDEDVRQGLKKHSDWPTYPQLYVHGELIGGLDIVKELVEEGTLSDQLGISAPSPALSLNERLKQLINQSPVMLFMKGLPSAPRCGFSRQMVELLNQYQIEFGAFDILCDEEVRQGLKTYSDWPTYPQLYVRGELLGGLDIVQEMHSDGSLKEALGGQS